MPRQVKDGALPEGVHDMRILSTEYVKEERPNHKDREKVETLRFVKVRVATKIGEVFFRERITLSLNGDGRYWSILDLKAMGFDASKNPLPELNLNPLKGRWIKVGIARRAPKDGNEARRYTSIHREEEVVELDDFAREIQQLAQSMALRAGEGEQAESEPVKTTEISVEDLEEKSGLEFVDADEEDDAA